MRKTLLALIAVLTCHTTSARAQQCSLFGHTPESIINYIWTGGYPSFYYEPAPATGSYSMDWTKLLCQTLCNQGGGNGNNSELSATMKRIENKMDKLDALISKRVKQNEDDISQLIDRQQQLANLNDQRMQILAGLVKKNAEVLVETRQRLDEDQRDLEATLVLVLKLQEQLPKVLPNTKTSPGTSEKDFHSGSGTDPGFRPRDITPVPAVDKPKTEDKPEVVPNTKDTPETGDPPKSKTEEVLLPVPSDH